MAPIFARFFEAYPGIDLEIRLTDRFEDIEGLEQMFRSARLTR
jgi:DNA-binding transcriptional LysR family regulator